MLFLALALAETESAVDMRDELAHLEAVIAGLDVQSCAPALDGIYRRLEGIDPAAVDRGDLEGQEAGLTSRLWTVRLAAQDRLRGLHETGPVSEDCITGFRRFDLATRYAIDHLLMAQAGPEAWLTTDAFHGIDDLRSGDILVTRGNALSSAGIAHIGVIDSQFSHNAMVHIDPKGRAWTIEAYLERGGLVQPLDDFLAHGLGRIVVVRHDDGALAARAAHLAYQRVAFGAAIDYDEAFDSSDGGEQLFCSEIGPWAFQMAGGPDDMPLHKTVFPHASNGAMFASLGVVTDTLAAPVDLLFDPRFAVVGEWRDLESLETMRRQDAVVEAMFGWMEQETYALDASWAHRATVDVGLALRRTPGLSRVVQSRIHPHGDRQFLVTGLALQDAGERLHEAFEQALGHEAHPSRARMSAVLEQIREDDLAVWQAHPRKASVHRVLHP
jgi:hypothetical protein